MSRQLFGGSSQEEIEQDKAQTSMAWALKICLLTG